MPKIFLPASKLLNVGLMSDYSAHILIHSYKIDQKNGTAFVGLIFLLVKLALSFMPLLRSYEARAQSSVALARYYRVQNVSDEAVDTYADEERDHLPLDR